MRRRATGHGEVEWKITCHLIQVGTAMGAYLTRYCLVASFEAKAETGSLR